MGAKPTTTRASIIVPCCNRREFTQLCVRALLQHTRPAWELIVVDNGSTDGTGPYLEGVRDAAPERGDREEEDRLWRAVLAECPGDREAAARLARRFPGPVAPDIASPTGMTDERCR